MQSKNSASNTRVPSARGQARKPPTPSPYLTTTELMAKIRNSASSSVADQLTRVMEIRNKSISKTRGSTGSARPLSKSSRDSGSFSDLNKDPSSIIDFSKDRNRLFAQKGSFDKPGPTKSMGYDNPLTQLPPFCPPRKLSSSRASCRKPVPRTKEENYLSEPVTNDFNEPACPSYYKNLGMGDTPLVGESDSNSKENLLKKGPLKSILKTPAYIANGGFGPSKLKNRVVLSDEDIYNYESSTWSNGFMARRISSNSDKPKTEKKVRFLDEIRIHPVPYESRGSTEWQHNLLLSREMMLQRFLSDPRMGMGLFPDLFGSKTHPVASMHETYELPSKPKPQIRHRPTPRFPRKF